MNMKTTGNFNHQRGFSLLEVMVALVIFSIGLIGLAGLQSASLGYNHSAYLRSQANYLAYNILDKMRANPERAKAGSYVVGYTGTGTNRACYYSSTGTCSFTDIVDTDIYEWKQALTVLPNGKGKIQMLSGSGANVHEVTIEWDDPISTTNKSTITVRSET